MCEMNPYELSFKFIFEGTWSLCLTKWSKSEIHSEITQTILKFGDMNLKNQLISNLNVSCRTSFYVLWSLCHHIPCSVSMPAFMFFVFFFLIWKEKGLVPQPCDTFLPPHSIKKICLNSLSWFYCIADAAVIYHFCD